MLKSMKTFVTFAVKVITFSRSQHQEKAFCIHESTPMMDKVVRKSPVVKNDSIRYRPVGTYPPGFPPCLRMANHYDARIIIVIGKSTRKVGDIRVMGSTARRVSRMSNLPVLVVPNY